jgi:hypothetical protein
VPSIGSSPRASTHEKGKWRSSTIWKLGCFSKWASTCADCGLGVRVCVCVRVCVMWWWWWGGMSQGPCECAAHERVCDAWASVRRMQHAAVRTNVHARGGSARPWQQHQYQHPPAALTL